MFTGGGKIALYPNPVTSNLTLSGVVPGSKVEVVSLSGVRLATTTAVAEGQTVVNVSKLPAGVYLLRAGGTTVKFIKK